MSRLLEKYNKEIIPALQDKFSYKSKMAVPKIEKVVVNAGAGGRLQKEPKFRERIERDLAMITGQKPSFRPARISISSFKVRKGQIVGFKVTLRKKRMYDFIDRLISVALPRSRDFRGIELKAVDKEGNLNIGIKEQTIFPEVIYESSKDVFPFQVTVKTTAKTREEGIELLKLFGFPLKTG